MFSSNDSMQRGKLQAELSARNFLRGIIIKD